MSVTAVEPSGMPRAAACCKKSPGVGWECGWLRLAAAVAHASPPVASGRLRSAQLSVCPMEGIDGGAIEGGGARVARRDLAGSRIALRRAQRP